MWCFLHILWYWPGLYIKSLTWNWRTYEGHIHGNLIPSKSVSYFGFCCIMYHPRTKSGALFSKLYAIVFLNFLMAVHTLQFFASFHDTIWRADPFPDKTILLLIYTVEILTYPVQIRSQFIWIINAAGEQSIFWRHLSILIEWMLIPSAL